MKIDGEVTWAALIQALTASLGIVLAVWAVYRDRRRADRERATRAAAALNLAIEADAFFDWLDDVFPKSIKIGEAKSILHVGPLRELMAQLDDVRVGDLESPEQAAAYRSVRATVRSIEGVFARMAGMIEVPRRSYDMPRDELRGRLKTARETLAVWNARAQRRAKGPFSAAYWHQGPHNKISASPSATTQPT